MSGSEKRSGLTRRGFLKASSIVAGTTALSGLTGCASGSVDTLAATGGEEVFTSACMWTCSNCQYDVYVRDGRIVKAAPKQDWVDKGGSRMCLRGMTQFQRIYQPERIKYPMKRKSWSAEDPHPELRGEDEWERIEWDEAIALITDKWKADQEKYGNQSVAVHHASGNTGLLNGVIGGLMPRLSYAMGMIDLDTCADAALNHGLYRVFGQGTAPENEIKDIVNAKTIVVWGANLTGYIATWQWVADAVENGSKLIVIDPVFNGTSAKADKWLAPRPGADIVIMMGMMNYIVSNDLHDKEFLLEHSVAPVLINPETKLYMRMSDLGVDPVPGPIDELGQQTLIDPPVVWDLDSNSPCALEEANQPALSGTFTIGDKEVRTAFDYLVDEIDKYPLDVASEITGLSQEDIIELAETSLDVPVFHYVFFGTQAYPNGVHLGHTFATLAAITGNVGMPGASLRAGGHYFAFDMMGALVSNGNMATMVPILELGDIMTSGMYMGQPFPVKSIYIYSANPLGGVPDEGKFREEALGPMDMIVVAETQFTDTAKYSDIILPAAHWYETTDVQVLSISWPGVRYIEKAVEPPYECKPDSEIARMLADKMGLGEYFQMTDEEFLRSAVDNSAYAQAHGITYDRLQQEKAIRINVDDPQVAVPDLNFNTSTGRIEFYCENPVPRMDYGQAFDVDGERLPRFFPPYEAWPDTEASEKYPLILMSERHVGRWHTSANCSWISELIPEPTLRINPQDARERGIENGDYIEAVNDRGHAVAKAILDESVQPGSVLYTKNWLKLEHKAGGWSEMCSAAFDPVGVNSNFMDNRCEIRKWFEEA